MKSMALALRLFTESCGGYAPLLDLIGFSVRRGNLCLHVDRCGKLLGMRANGAGYRIRTRGPLITNQVLYQLS